MSHTSTLPSFARHASRAAITSLALASLVGCTSTHETTILIDKTRDAHVLATGSHPVVELCADPATNVEVEWQVSAMPTEKQTVSGYLARTLRGGGAFVLSSTTPASVRVICKGATGFGVTQSARAKGTLGERP